MARLKLTTAQLASLAFTPGSSSAGQSSAFTYSVTDGAGNQTMGSATLSGYGNPAITGLQPTTTSRQNPTRPFALAVVSDPANGATDTVTIASSGAAGTLSGKGPQRQPGRNLHARRR